MAAPPAGAADFPPLTDAERALSAATQPDAPAVVLFRKGELWILDSARGQEVSSRLVVRERWKILSTAGQEYGNARISHSGHYRLTRVAGRTVLPDGRVVPLPGDAVFKATLSQAERAYRTSVAFPAVAPGAVLDLEYEIRWDSPYFLDPWYFQDRIPVRHSEIVYHLPRSMKTSLWQRDPMHAGIHIERGNGPQAVQLRDFADDLKPVPAEPHGPPFADMAAQEMMIPTAFTTYDVYLRLFDTWSSTAKLFDEVYGKVRRRDGGVAEKARSLAASGAARDKAAAIYAFVRDEIATDDHWGIGIDENAALRRVLADRRGTPTAKALLLQVMLAAVGIESRPVWAADRERGRIDLKVTNPDWFERTLVAATIDGRRTFLDPNDRSLAFGRLAPQYEGTPAVVVDPANAESLTLPETPAAENLRRARLDLAIGADGRAAGRGTLVLAGQRAWEKTRREPDAARAAESWKSWLETRLPGFAIRGVAVAESTAEPRVEVSWEMAESAAERDADEITLAPGRPLGPLGPMFPKGVRRVSPILLDFASRDETELALTWPAGWRVEALPKAHAYETPAGAAVIEVKADPAARRLTYRRLVSIAHRDAASRAQVDAVLALCDEIETIDAEPLVLARR
jgi:hypothetical protein